MRTNDTIKAYERYILESMDFSGYDMPNNTEREKLESFVDCFVAVYGHEIVRQGSIQKAIAEYLMGLPSHTNIDFYNHDILARAVRYGSLPENATEKQEDKILDNYWSYMAMRILSLVNRHNISVWDAFSKTKWFQDNKERINQ